ncbi:MAG TPA: hypothetical protein VGC22_11125, partial [Chitinophaga sp.]
MNFWKRLFPSPAPQPDGKPQVTLKERLDALRMLPAFFKLVWETNRWMTLVNALLRLIRAATPLAILYIGKIIIDLVVQLHNGKQADTHHLWWMVGLEFALAIGSDALG